MATWRIMNSLNRACILSDRWPWFSVVSWVGEHAECSSGFLPGLRAHTHTLNSYKTQVCVCNIYICICVCNNIGNTNTIEHARLNINDHPWYNVGLCISWWKSISERPQRTMYKARPGLTSSTSWCYAKRTSQRFMTSTRANHCKPVPNHNKSYVILLYNNIQQTSHKPENPK